jgi:hypothetical protein
MILNEPYERLAISSLGREAGLELSEKMLVGSPDAATSVRRSTLLDPMIRSCLVLYLS